MDHRDLSRAIARLVALATEAVPSPVAVRALADVAHEVLGVDGVGVVLLGFGSEHVLHATTEAADELERVQEQRSGPGAEAVRSGAVVVAHGSARLQPWPEFSAVAQARGICGVTCMPLMVRDRCWGVLSLYTAADAPLPPDVLEGAGLLVDVASAHLAMAADAEEARAARAELVTRATHDPVTGASTRLVLSARLDHALVDSRLRGGSIGVLFIDVDDFQAVRRTLGTTAGEDVLRETARRIGRQLRQSDTLARLADDEFVVMCCDLPTTAGPMTHLRQVTERIHLAMTEAVQTASGSVEVALSIGEAVSSGDEHAHHLIDEADRAMYRSRASRSGS